MLRNLIKILLAVIVALLLPDDNPMPPPWYLEFEEVAVNPSHLFGFPSSETAAIRTSYKTELPETAGRRDTGKQ